MTIEEKLVVIAANEEKVYQAGYNKGQDEADTETAYNEGYNKGYEEGENDGYFDGLKDGMADGKEGEHNSFWEAFQEEGTRQDYQYAFYGTGWTDNTYKPIYIPKPTKASYMYRYSLLTKIEVDFTNLQTSSAVFGNCGNLQSVKIKSSKNTVWGNGLFQYATNTSFKELIIEGVIGRNISVSGCNYLTRNSLMSVINALYDYSNDTGTYTLTMGTTNLNKLTAAEKAIATEKGWSLA